MRVRRFVGDSVADTMGKVKRELGSEAVILQTREFREGGFLGLFGKMRVEISAAIEDKPMAGDKSPETGHGNTAEESSLPFIKPVPVNRVERDQVFIDNFLSRLDVVSGTARPNPNLNPNPHQNANLHAYRSAAELTGARKAAVEPERIAAEPGKAAEAGRTVAEAGKTVTEPGRTIAEAGKTVTEPGRTVAESGRTVAEAGTGAAGPGKAETGPGKTETEAGKVQAGQIQAGQVQAGQVQASQDQSRFLQEELGAMRQMLEKMNKQMEGLSEEKSGWPQPLQKWADFLENRGINQNLVNLLIRHVQQTLQPEEWSNNQRVFSRLEANVRQICGQIGLIQPGLNGPRVVALIGATGVGKTTTIGKLAAGFSIADKRRVALITVDTYRVAAVEQLKTFGEIIGVPVKVVMNPAGLREAIDSFADRELIFIDTAGRSPYHDLHMADLRTFLEHARPDFTMLVLSATTQYSDQLKVYRRFEPLTTHLIFTKLDETGSAGAILNILGQTTLPTAYLSNGQSVPDDIEAATPNRLARYVLGTEMPHA